MTWARVEHSVKMRLEMSSNLDFTNMLELAVHAIKWEASPKAVWPLTEEIR